MKFYFYPTIFNYTHSFFITHVTFEGCKAILSKPPIFIQGQFLATFDYVIIRKWVSSDYSGALTSIQADLNALCLFIEDCYVPLDFSGSNVIRTFNLNINLDGSYIKNCPALDIKGKNLAYFDQCRGNLKNLNTSTSQSSGTDTHLSFGDVGSFIDLSFLNIFGNIASAAMYRNLTTTIDSFNIIKNTLLNNLINLFSTSQVMRNGCFFQNTKSSISARLENCWGDIEKEDIEFMNSVSSKEIKSQVYCIHSDDFSERWDIKKKGIIAEMIVFYAND